MNSYSQAGQDIFVRKLLPNIQGTFWDIGCGGRSISNTLALEEEGWNGLLLDNSAEAQKDSIGRSSEFVLADATRYRFPEPEHVDYLSLDVNGASLDALRNLPLHKTRFSVITIEHDAWRFGDTLRTPQRRVLWDSGYHLICGNVANPEPFEDWWCCDELWEAAAKFIADNHQWKDILARA